LSEHVGATLCSLLLFLLRAPPPPHVSTLSLHDALPICARPACSPGHHRARAPSSGAARRRLPPEWCTRRIRHRARRRTPAFVRRSEEHTSELQSPCNLVCRLLLEKKKHIST